MTLVGLESHHLDRYPYEFSGGSDNASRSHAHWRPRPELLVLDEPVSALDVSTQSQVINLLERLQRETDAAYLFIAHDLAVVRHVCQRVAVMYHSRIVETGPVDEICERPTHPYSALLIASIPDPDPVVQREKSARRRALGRGIAGATGAPPVDACPFADRCPHVMDICHSSFPTADRHLGGRGGGVPSPHQRSDARRPPLERSRC